MPDMTEQDKARIANIVNGLYHNMQVLKLAKKEGIMVKFREWRSCSRS